MIDFQNASHLWETMQAFPLLHTIRGQCFRTYDYDVINQSDPMIYKVEFPTDKDVILFDREIDTQEELLEYRVLVGGSDSGGTGSLFIQNKNNFYQDTKPSGAIITKDVTLSGTQVELDYVPIYGTTAEGLRSSGGLRIDGKPRIYKRSSPVAYIQISTPKLAADQNFKLELQWAEL